MLKTANAEFSFIEIWFTDQNKRPLEIEDNVNITLIIGTGWYKNENSLEPKDRKYVQGCGFLSFATIFGDKYGKKLILHTKAGIDAGKTASKRVVQKAAESTGDLIGNKIITDEITSVGKSKNKEKEKKDETNEAEES